MHAFKSLKEFIKLRYPQTHAIQHTEIGRNRESRNVNTAALMVMAKHGEGCISDTQILECVMDPGPLVDLFRIVGGGINI